MSTCPCVIRVDGLQQAAGHVIQAAVSLMFSWPCMPTHTDKVVCFRRPVIQALELKCFDAVGPQGPLHFGFTTCAVFVFSVVC